MGFGSVVEGDVGDGQQLGGVVTELRVLADEVHDVEAEPVDPPVEPEAGHIVHGGHHLRIAPVEVGLLGEEAVQVVLAGHLVQRPGGHLAEGRHPVVRWPAIGGGRTPDVPVPLRIVAARSRRHEPGVLVRGVVGNPVDDDLQTPIVGVMDDAVDVVEVTEEGVHGAVIGHVVAEVGHGRSIERRQPEGIDAQPGQVVQMGPHAGEIPDSVTVGVGEGPRVDLVEHPGLPPRNGPHRSDPRVRPVARAAWSHPLHSNPTFTGRELAREEGATSALRRSPSTQAQQRRPRRHPRCARCRALPRMRGRSRARPLIVVHVRA